MESRRVSISVFLLVSSILLCVSSVDYAITNHNSHGKNHKIAADAEGSKSRRGALYKLLLERKEHKRVDEKLESSEAEKINSKEDDRKNKQNEIELQVLSSQKRFARIAMRYGRAGPPIIASKDGTKGCYVPQFKVWLNQEGCKLIQMRFGKRKRMSEEIKRKKPKKNEQKPDKNNRDIIKMLKLFWGNAGTDDMLFDALKHEVIESRMNPAEDTESDHLKI